MRNILDVATVEFSDKGYAGARVDEIARRTASTKRMLYYYFGDKEGLYIAVLERSYSHIREIESSLDVESLEPVDAIRALAELTFDHHLEHPDFVRLVANENIHRGVHIRQSEALRSLGNPALDVLGTILERGHASGAFARAADPLDVHMLISAYSVFCVANRYTFDTLFHRDLASEESREHLRTMVGDVIVGYLCHR
ncbi:TetR/AcrR family transcriptional regulator [Tomitella gaofuii]|uniref:TetR/AcrR family transcriptional regulator n=1 Tax=Tomitella gaofuii TaxID=2760083 RepID=UPI0015FDE68E|nr:TetR/AcrR family transcriptional regulator [Tomitella gaofuii]